ncbi:MAG: DUF4288 domain-containing protein [Bacteroidetes bacterium]|nr:DUF4288 domain-containing protein [Bacteroidota bacterium]
MKTHKIKIMQQYLAKLMFNIDVEQGEYDAQFDEQVRIIESTDFETAFQKARSIGKNEESSFLNKDNKLVSWKFIDVVELFPLKNAKDGEQLFSITHEEQNASTFINFVREKSMMLQVKSLTFA